VAILRQTEHEGFGAALSMFAKVGDQAIEHEFPQAAHAQPDAGQRLYQEFTGC
jgi:hypothetical protein